VYDDMAMREAPRQMSAQAERPGVGEGEALSDPGSDEADRPRHDMGNTGPGLLLAVLARENLQRAWKRVKANKGAAGVDGLDISQTAAHLRTAWLVIRDQLLSGTYRPMPVRRVMIPKPGGGERELGIPTVTDRLIQQALLQVLQPILDPTFSKHSYGFGRAEARMMPFLRRNPTCNRATGSWLMWTWRSSSTGSITTSSSTVFRSGSATPG
jgi:hypothetical protein